MDVVNIMEKRKSNIYTLKNEFQLKNSSNVEKYKNDNFDDIYSFEKKESNFLVCGFSYEKIKSEEEPIRDDKWNKHDDNIDSTEFDIKNLLYRSKYELSNK